MPGLGNGRGPAESDDVYAGHNGDRLPEVKLKGLPPSFMFGLQGFDHGSLAQPRRTHARAKDSAPSTTDSDEGELRRWLSLADPQSDPAQVFGRLTRGALPADGPARRLLRG